MSCLYIITLDGERHCVDIPMLIEVWPDPDPDPWMHNLSLLDLVSQVAQRVSDVELAQGLAQLADAHVQRLQASLPDQLQIEIRTPAFAV